MAAITATAAAAAKDQVPQRQNTKKTQHPFLSSVLLYTYRSSGTCTAYRIGLLKYRTGSEKYHRFFPPNAKKSPRNISMMPDRASGRAGPRFNDTPALFLKP